MALTARLLTLRRSPLLLKLPPYLSTLCILAGIIWLLLLPLNDYSRQTYISENAILPGQVHTYFGGSEHHVFRAYRQEVFRLSEASRRARLEGLEQILGENDLKVARQDYMWKVGGEEVGGTNVYGVLQGPRADATEAMVLVAAWRNFEGAINYSGVALALTLARYFKRWSIWSKDVLVLIPEDSVFGPEAWVEAYHGGAMEATPSRNVSALPIKAGALQGAVALDYPAGPWGHRYDKLDVLYDGINGALPNLDLLNTAISVAGGQIGVGATLHGRQGHRDSYKDRLGTMGKGLLTQSAGHATGPHSAFMPYHVDAITLKTIGDGWHDEMHLGRVAESLFRSINNLLEHFHQSFFFYILLNTNRFVSIGNYLPAAMIIAGSFTITALGLWVQSGRAPMQPDVKPGSPIKKRSQPKMDAVKTGGDVAFVPRQSLQPQDRGIFHPIAILLATHLLGLVPFYLLTHLPSQHLTLAYTTLTTLSLLLPLPLARHLATHTTRAQTTTLHALSLLLLAATLSTLATLNFPLAFLLGLLCTPLNYLRPLPALPSRASIQTSADASDALSALAKVLPAAALYAGVCPLVLAGFATRWCGVEAGDVLGWMVRAWVTQGVWTGVVGWGVWLPAWVVGGAVLGSGCLRKEEEGEGKKA